MRTMQREQRAFKVAFGVYKMGTDRQLQCYSSFLSMCPNTFQSLSSELGAYVVPTTCMQDREESCELLAIDRVLVQRGQAVNYGMQNKTNYRLSFQ